MHARRTPRDAPSVGYELLHRQVTRAQGLFSPRTVNVHFALDYMVSYEKRPFYPFSTWSTEGVLTGYADTKKEIWTCAVCAVLIAVMTVARGKFF